MPRHHAALACVVIALACPPALADDAAPPVTDADRRQVEAAITAMNQAIRDNDREAIAAGLDPLEMMHETARLGLMPAAAPPPERLAPLVAGRLPALMTDPVNGIGAKRYEVKTITRRGDAGDRFVAFTRQWDDDDVAGYYRWSLRRDGEALKVYDIELLDIGVGYAAMLGVGFSAAEEDDTATKRAADVFVRLSGLATMGDLDAAERALDEVDPAAVPPVIAALYWVARSGLAYDRGEQAEALAAAEKAIGLKPDTPFAYSLAAAALNRLGRHDEALKRAEQYRKLLGTNAEYLELVGRARAGQGDAAEAAAAYLKGLKDDPQYGETVLALLELLPPARKREAVAPHYKRLTARSEWFVAFADRLVDTEDAASLRVLIDLHSETDPADAALIEPYRRALDDMK